MDIPRLLGGRYEITRLLRTGHITQVHEGLDRRDQRQVAIEILRSVHCHDQAVVGRFRTAGHVAAGLTHPHIAQVSAAGETQGLGFLVRELIDGPALRDVLSNEGRLPPARAGELALQICQALSFAHRVGVLHGGLNPSDILLTGVGDAKVAGFGVAISIGTVESLDARYIAPEQAQHLETDGRADLYGLGCCLYEMLLGRPPFAGDPQMLERIKSRVPSQLGNVLRKLLAVQPQERYQSASEVIIDLRRYLDSVGASAPAEPQQPRSRTQRREGVHRASPEPESEDEPSISDATRRALNRSAVLATVCLLLAGTIAVTTNVLDFGSELTVGSGQVEDDDGGDGGSVDGGTDGQSDGDPATGSSSTTASSSTTTTERETTTTTERDRADLEEGSSSSTSTSAPPDTTTTTETGPTTTEPEPATVPSVVGMTEGQASSTLASHGLSMATSRVRVYDSNQDGKVVSQSPGGGAPVPGDGTVRVEVGYWCVLLC